MPPSIFPDNKTVAVATFWKGGSSNDVNMGEMLEKYGYGGTFVLEAPLSEETAKRLSSLGHDFALEEPTFPQNANLFRHRYSDTFNDISDTWMKIEDVEGSILLLYGDPSELPSDTKQWLDFECIMGYLGGISHVWYGSAAELAAYLEEGK
ncbi:MAG: hypothetical protein H7308_16445 [Chthonomonadaceae bacterium]|nr:hypothetical protein [Chthonomonadaceae bacterium]